MTDTTLYWHDYETFGANPALDRPSQFAGIRTDLDFNIIGEPLVVYCKPTPDFLPHPEACLITGITPQHAFANGLDEAKFIARIHNELALPGTCGVGYNSIRFDDEVSRHTLYRNFYDPYAREWQNGNSRWDIIDMVRVCCALRPEGINWPSHEDGLPSFKLEHITQANGISHESAHDALSDVYATIAVAKLIKDKQPRLFDYLFKLRSKHEVAKLLNVASQQPVLHTSAMFGSERFCTTMIMPLAKHPTNSNGVICYDLSVDPQPLIELSAEEIRERLYTPVSELPEGSERIALKTVHINRCPVVATAKLLDDGASQRIKLDLPRARQHYQKLHNAEGLSAKLLEVFSSDNFPPKIDPDTMLYSGGFASNNDKNTMTEVRASSPEQLREGGIYFEDDRYNELLFRYRARNFPDSLSEDERQQWQEFCYQRLTDPEAGASLTMEDFLERMHELLAQREDDPDACAILNALLDYSDELLA